MNDIRINHSKFKLANGKNGVIAVLMYTGKGDPRKALDNAVSSMVANNEGYFELIDANLDNPWTRVIMTNINDMEQVDFDPTHQNLKTLLDEEADCS
jgi:hypothetical protein